ncbi:MAG: SdpI family protein [Clostridia bacterium]|nr:SdpI family protein [Clostridia bacterium]
MKELFRKNKWTMLVSSLVILLPVVFGLILWDRLPEMMAVHWGINGAVDGWSSPLFAIVFLPLFLLVLHWLCVLITWKDNAKNDQSRKVLGMVYWILPAISLLTGAIMYAVALGYSVSMLSVIWIILGATFILIGNYLPKCRHNRTIGIKIKWTLANEENWNKTHRIGGIVSVAAGVLCFPAIFLPMSAFPIAMLVLIAVCVGVPTVYSYCLYKKQLREGTATKADYAMPKTDKRIGWIAAVFTGLVLAFCVVLCFTGDIEVTFDDTSFTVDATYYSALTVSYADIESAVYFDEPVGGVRISGFGSPRLSLGWFEHDEIGSFTNYSYTNAPAYVLVTVDGDPLVISLKEASDTKAFYEALCARMEG